MVHEKGERNMKDVKQGLVFICTSVGSLVQGRHLHQTACITFAVRCTTTPGTHFSSFTLNINTYTRSPPLRDHFFTRDVGYTGRPLFYFSVSISVLIRLPKSRSAGSEAFPPPPPVILKEHV